MVRQGIAFMQPLMLRQVFFYQGRCLSQTTEARAWKLSANHDEKLKRRRLQLRSEEDIMNKMDWKFEKDNMLLCGWE